MNKRKRVPAALHAEIHEYSALIRALRTRDTLDLTSQLIRANAASSQAATDDGLLDDDDLALDVDEQRPDASSNAALPSGSSMEAAPLKRKRKRKAAPKKVRDHWTRWPLMPSDVHVPEWSLEDEVRVLAVHHVKSTLNAAAPAREEATLLEDMDDDFANTLLPPSSVDALSDEATSYLSRILALVATLRPPAAESMQNRFAPFNWEAVMAAVSSGGIADTKFVVFHVVSWQASINLCLLESCRMSSDAWKQYTVQQSLMVSFLPCLLDVSVIDFASLQLLTVPRCTLPEERKQGVS